jgi:hypothetical protein
MEVLMKVAVIFGLRSRAPDEETSQTAVWTMFETALQKDNTLVLYMLSVFSSSSSIYMVPQKDAATAA